MSNKRCVYVVGVGQTKFEKPGIKKWTLSEMTSAAVREALWDAQLSPKYIQQATVGYLYGGTCVGQRCLSDAGIGQIPIYNLNNACAGSTSGLYFLAQLIQGGLLECGLAVGLEQMLGKQLDLVGTPPDNREQRTDRHIALLSEWYGKSTVDAATNPFPTLGCMAGLEYLNKYPNAKVEHFAKVAAKNRNHASNNPLAMNQRKTTVEDVLKSKQVLDFLTLLMCSPKADGAAAVVVCSESFINNHPHLKSQAVRMVGIEMGSDLDSTFTQKSPIKANGFDCIKSVAEKLYKETGLGVEDVQLIELHDGFATTEMMIYEALGMCPEGKAHELVDRGDVTYGGKWVVNPSGGLTGRGHPASASGIAQCAEICKHLRGIAGKRQVPNVRLGMQQSSGLAGATVVAIYTKDAVI